MKSEPQEILFGRSCKCGARPVYFFYDDPSRVIFHRVMCPRCGKKITRLSKFRVITAWNAYITGGDCFGF